MDTTIERLVPATRIAMDALAREAAESRSSTETLERTASLLTQLRAALGHEVRPGVDY